MAIVANRCLTLLLLFAGAVVSYAAGFIAGFLLLIAIGVVLELALWRELFRRVRGR